MKIQDDYFVKLAYELYIEEYKESFYRWKRWDPAFLTKKNPYTFEKFIENGKNKDHWFYNEYNNFVELALKE